MANKVKRILKRTISGDNAWKNLPLPPSERKLLSFIKEQVSEDKLREYIKNSKDDEELLIASFVKRGWARWEVEEDKEDKGNLLSDDLSPLDRLKKKAQERLSKEEGQFDNIKTIESDDFTLMHSSQETSNQDKIINNTDIVATNLDEHTKTDNEVANIEDEKNLEHPKIRGDDKRLKPTDEEIKRSLNLFLKMLNN